MPEPAALHDREPPERAHQGTEPAVPGAVHALLSRDRGTPLDAATRRRMERRFGEDFGGVRVHAGTDAADSARALRARAYTVGHDIVFGAGRHAPDSPDGERLLTHELAHVVQQRRGGPPPTQDSGSHLEQAAAAAATHDNAGGPVQVAGAASVGVARDGEENQQQQQQQPAQAGGEIKMSRLQASFAGLDRSHKDSTEEPKNHDRAQRTLQAIYDYFQEITTREKIDALVRGHNGATATRVRLFVEIAVDSVKALVNRYRESPPTAGFWDMHLNRIWMAREFLQALAGDIPWSPTADAMDDSFTLSLAILGTALAAPVAARLAVQAGFAYLTLWFTNTLLAEALMGLGVSAAVSLADTGTVDIPIQDVVYLLVVARGSTVRIPGRVTPAGQGRRTFTVTGKPEKVGGAIPARTTKTSPGAKASPPAKGGGGATTQAAPTATTPPPKIATPPATASPTATTAPPQNTAKPATGQAGQPAPPATQAAPPQQAPAGNILPGVTVNNQMIDTQIQAARAYFPGHGGAVGTLLADGRAPMRIKSGVEGGPWGGTHRGGVPRGRGWVFSGGGSSQGNIATHVEGHTAAIMHQQGIQRAILFVSEAECSICSNGLSASLPPGAVLVVYSPGAPPNVYRSSQRGR